MRRVTRHLRVGLVATTAIIIGAFPVLVSAAVAPTLALADAPDVFITEIQTNGGSAAQEFVELYNATDHDVHFADTAAGSTQWKLQFFNSTSVKSGAPSWATSATASNSVTLTGMVSAHDYYVISSTGYAPGSIQPDQSYDASSSHLMTDTGGGLQLLSSVSTASPIVSTVHDRAMWLAAASGTTIPVGVMASPATGKSLQRLPNDDNEYVNSDGTLTDFGPADTISPLDAWQAPAPIIPVTPPVDETDTGDTTTNVPSDSSTGGSIVVSSDPVDNTGLIAPQITEILANPASPKTDAVDEFIEIFNPNDAPFDLKGYALEVGTTTLHDFTFSDDVVLAANSYQAFYSASTKLSLTNSGGQARLLDAGGEIVSQSADYAAAGDDASWSLADGTWQWSTTPTPGAPNTITTVPVAIKSAAKAATVAKATAVKTTAIKATTAKAKGSASTKKPTVKKVAVKKVTKKKAATKKTTALSTAATVKPKPPIHTGILVGVAVAAVLYGLYEYRHDISNKFNQLRGNRGARRSDRGEIAWRRGYSSE